MVQKHLSIDYIEYESIDQLDKNDAQLINSAIEASKGSYAPYSKFNVGAAVRLDNGEIVSASNQENAAFPSGLCAERVAVFYASAKYPEQSVDSIAIIALKDGQLLPTPTYPCGACRQVLAEYEQRGGRKMRILTGSGKVVQVFEGVASLLPFIFDNLK
ncbi:MAG: cytidine deaminase [Bacteroidales bacterium]|nr:cytidine deaminase [Bacteroidales bacterium]MDD4671026.1 cytidine deaminase [Bacteroidales bacterium]